MSLLHPSDDDRAFEAGHQAAGDRMKEARIKRLEDLLRRAVHYPIPQSLLLDIEAALKMTAYDETAARDGR